MTSRRKNLPGFSGSGSYRTVSFSETPYISDASIVPFDFFWDMGSSLDRENIELFKETFKLPISLTWENFPDSPMYAKPLTYARHQHEATWLSRRVKTVTCSWIPDRAYRSQKNYSLEIQPFVVTFKRNEESFSNETDPQKARRGSEGSLRPYGGCIGRGVDWNLIEQLFYSDEGNSITLVRCQDINALPQGEGTFVRHGGVIHHDKDFSHSLPPYISLGHALRDGAWKVVIKVSMAGVSTQQQVYRSSDYHTDPLTQDSYVVFTRCQSEVLP